MSGHESGAGSEAQARRDVEGYRSLIAEIEGDIDAVRTQIAGLETIANRMRSNLKDALAGHRSATVRLEDFLNRPGPLYVGLRDRTGGRVAWLAIPEGGDFVYRLDRLVNRANSLGDWWKVLPPLDQATARYRRHLYPTSHFVFDAAPALPLFDSSEPEHCSVDALTAIFPTEDERPSR